MSVWYLVPMALSMGSSYAGQKAQNEAMVSGAETNAEIEAMNREFQKKMFNKQIEMQKPFYEEGLKALPLYEQATYGKLPFEKSGLGKLQEGLISKEISGYPSYIKDMALSRLRSEEGEKQKGRLMDLEKIGLGASGLAGESNVRLGNALAGSYLASGGAMANATMNKYMGTQSAWNRAIDQLSGIPAYLSSMNRNQSPYDSTPNIYNQESLLMETT